MTLGAPKMYALSTDNFIDRQPSINNLIPYSSIEVFEVLIDTNKLKSTREVTHKFKLDYPHPVSRVNNRLYYEFSTSLTKTEKKSQF